MTQLELVRSELNTFRDHLDQACDALNRMDSYAGGCMPDINKIKKTLDKMATQAVSIYNHHAQAVMSRPIVTHEYKGNKIIEYPAGDCVATRFAEDSEDIVSHNFDSLTEAKAWIDKYVKEC